MPLALADGIFAAQQAWPRRGSTYGGTGSSGSPCRPRIGKQDLNMITCSHRLVNGQTGIGGGCSLSA